MSDGTTLEQLQRTIDARLAAGASESSYVATLAEKGLDAVLKKVGEEATEVVLAAKAVELAKGAPESKEAHHELVHEIVDLWFHTMVAMRLNHVELNDLYTEIERRMGVSGLEEKASRK